MLSDFPIIPLFSLGERDVSDGRQDALVNEASLPFEGGQLQRLHCFPWHPLMDQLGLVQIIDGLGQGVVVALTFATAGRPSLHVADGNVLRTAIRVMGQAGIPLWLASLERQFHSNG